MDEVLCGKCEDPFTDPRILPCLHSFCLKCLQKLSENTNEPFQCPTCEEKVPLPEGGVQAFTKDQCKAHEAEKARLNDKIEKGEAKCDRCVRTNSNAAVAFCVQCRKFLCEACRDDHHSWRETLDHEIIPTGERLSKDDEGSVLSKYHPQPLICSTHKKNLERYCKHCKTLICLDCKDSKLHKSHSEQCLLIDEVADEEMKSLKISLSSCEGAGHKLDDAIDSCRKTREDVKARKKAVDDMITSSLERVRHTLLEQNATICDKKVGTLDIQERELVRIRKGLAQASRLIKDSSRSLYTPDQQLSTKDVIATKVDELLKEFQGKDLDPQENDRVLTQVDQEATITKVISLCQVSEGAHPASSTFDSTLPSHIFPGKEYTMKIKARNRQGKALGCGGERVKVNIGYNGAGVACQCIDNHDGTYTVHYTPQSAGHNKLHAMIAGQPIKGSPLICQVREGVHPASCSLESVPKRIYSGTSYTMKVVVRDRHSKMVSNSGERVEVKIGPEHVAKYTDNHDGTHTVHYTPQLAGDIELHTTINGQPIKESPLKITVKQPRPYTTLSDQSFFNTNYASPYDVAITDDGHFAVAEYSSHMVSFYDKNTKKYMFSFGIGSAGANPNQLYSPQGVAIKGDTLYVAEYAYNRIKTFSISRKQYITTFGTESGQLSNPRGICLDSEGKLFVSNYGNHCIQVFKDGGHYQYSIAGDPAIAGSQFQNPWGIALDLDGNLHIAAYSSNCIKVFSPTGSYISTYGKGTISGPAGIAINGEGVIAISEYSGSNRLWLYDRDRKTLLNTFTGVFSNGIGIACDDEDVFWVAASGNNRVFRF